MLPLIQHLPTPGDHYSPFTGSAVMTVVHGLVRAHQAQGGRSDVLVAAGTYSERYPEGRVVEYAPLAALPGPRARRRDALLGATLRPRGASLAPWLSAAAAVRAEGVTLVHNGQQVGPALPGGTRRVLYAHNTLFRSYSPWEARRVVSGFDAVVAVSRFLADEVVARAGHRTPVHVVHNGVDPDVFHPVAEREPGPTRLLFLGRVIPEKGVHLSLEALTRLPGLKFELQVVGSSGFARQAALTAYEQQLRAQAVSLGVRVSFTPFVPRSAVPALMRRADVVLVPSLVREGLPLALLEGMASGAACVAADVGGIPEAVGDAGRLFPRGDVAALTDVLEDLLTDAAGLARTRAACLQASRRFSWSAAHTALLGAVAA